MILFAIVFTIYFLISYNKPNCFDGIKNQNELGVDCGGLCVRLCPFQVAEPIVLWSRSFEVSPGVYNAVAFIENPNSNSSSEKFSYVFRLRDQTGVVIAERAGESSIPNNRIMAIFESGIRTDREIIRTDFDFTNELVWNRDLSVLPDVSARRMVLSREDTSPRLDVQIENREIVDIKQLEATAVIFDGSGTAIGASRTFINDFKKNSIEDIVFTWPNPFIVQEKVCQVPVDVMLVFDRSGSMVFDNWNLENPEPLTTAKSAALDFLEGVKSVYNRVGLVSFATEATLDNPISDNYLTLRNSIAGINIKALTPAEVWTQETNIAHGLELALKELDRQKLEGSERIIVLFTDGVPTHPKMAGRPEHPLDYTKDVSENIKNRNISIFSIGLGREQVDEVFLKEISSSPSHYFSAPRSTDLNQVFSELAEEICKEAPATIDVILRQTL